jgi:alpha-L-fucosidase
MAAGQLVPSKELNDWSQFELGVMISYDLITQLTDVPNPQHFCIGAGGDKNLTIPPASAFNPVDLAAAPAQWMDVTQSLGAKYAVYVAMHCSGFAQWPSKVYNYSLTQTPLAAQDPVKAYVEEANKRGISPGLYITWNYNALYNVGMPGGRVQPGPLGPGQVPITDAQYQTTAMDVLTEIYTEYKGQIGEVWFDGGESNPAVNSLMQSAQPQAVYCQGQAPSNNVRIAGFESGFLSYPVWSRGTPGQSGSGAPDGPAFLPIESDTTISEQDAWFWKPSMTYRPLSELKAVYVNSVGANANLLLGLMPNATGLIDEAQSELVAELGAWINKCYGPDAPANHSGPATGGSVTLAVPDNTVIDRVVLREDQSAGAQVASFTVEILPLGGYRQRWMPAGEGTAIGNKRILFLPTGPMPVAGIRVNVAATLPGAVDPSGVIWRDVAAHEPCD